MKLKILKIAMAPNNRTGGMSRTMYFTGDHLQERGHEVDYLFAESFACFGPGQLHRYTASWEADRLVLAALNAGKEYNLIEMHEPLTAVYGARRSRDRRLPVLAAFSYGLEEGGREAMLNYRKLRGIPLRLLSRLTTWVSLQQVRYGLSRSDLVVCSNGEDLRFLASRGFSGERLLQHHSGVEPGLLNYRGSDPGRNLHRILFVGMWTERKGILEIVESFREVAAREPAARLTLAGTVFSVEQVLAAFPVELRDRVTVIPRVTDQATLIQIYLEHGQFILPSYYEGQPLSLIEAAAMGLVPIVSDIGGNRDFIQEGENGYLIPVGDSKLLATRILQVIQHPQLAVQLAGKAQLLAASHTWDASAENLEKGYLRAVERR